MTIILNEDSKFRIYGERQPLAGFSKGETEAMAKKAAKKSSKTVKSKKSGKK